MIKAVNVKVLLVKCLSILKIKINLIIYLKKQNNIKIK